MIKKIIRMYTKYLDFSNILLPTQFNWFCFLKAFSSRSNFSACIIGTNNWQVFFFLKKNFFTMIYWMGIMGTSWTIHACIFSVQMSLMGNDHPFFYFILLVCINISERNELTFLIFCFIYSLMISFAFYKLSL